MKNFLYLLTLIISTLPVIALAQQTLQVFAMTIPVFIFSIIVPFLFGISFFVFVFNVIRYFVIDSRNEEGREKAKTLATYGLVAFMFLVLFFGIVRILVATIGINVGPAPCPDYLVGLPGGC